MMYECIDSLLVPMPGNPRSPCRLGETCCEACPNRLLVASGGGSLVDVRPDSPSRNITFLLLRVAARLKRGVSVLRDALGMFTHDSRVLVGSSGGAAILNRDACARRQAPTTSQTTAQSRFAWGILHRQKAGFNDEGGGRLRADGRGRDGLNSP